MEFDQEQVLYKRVSETTLSESVCMQYIVIDVQVCAICGHFQFGIEYSGKKQVSDGS